MTEKCPLDDVLDLMRVRGAVMARLRAQAPWGMHLPQASSATFHAVTAGTCWLRRDEFPPLELFPGDIVLLPTGAPHSLASDATGPTVPWERVAKSRALTAGGELILDGPGNSAQIICAAYDYDHQVAHPFLSILPTLIYVAGQTTLENSAVPTTLRLLHCELSSRSPGRGTIIDRLIDVLFVHVIRTWAASDENNCASWLGALRDPVIGRALSALHTTPANPWSIDRLAREVNVSRATLTRRFTALVGEAPLAYLTRWRMDLAASHLRDSDDAVSAIARRVGYTSEFAFSRAFVRARGRPPGRYRTEMRTVPAVR